MRCIIFLILILFMVQEVRLQCSTDKPGITSIRWCTYTIESTKKCDALAAVVNLDNKYKTEFHISCIQKLSLMDCMASIHEFKDCNPNILNLESGLAFFGADLYTLKPVVAENYDATTLKLDFVSTILVRKSSGVTLDNLKEKTLCSSGVGKSDGWTIPLSKLIEMRKIEVKQCNSMVVTITNFFKGMCLPGAMTSVFNTFGSNSISACTLCASEENANKYCKYNDDFAHTDGAMRCLVQRNADVAFLRADEAIQYATVYTDFKLEDFELLCPDGKKVPVADFATCNWGTSPSNLIVTSIQSNAAMISEYRRLFQKLNTDFGTPSAGFSLYSSEGYGSGPASPRNLLFSDLTKSLYDSTNTDVANPLYKDLTSIYNWLGPVYHKYLENLRYCPLLDVRWCVISQEELTKCERMKLSFSAKGLKPDLNCIESENVIQCMQLIKKGLADVINLDAGDLYVAGKQFGLVPFVSEFYGDSNFYYAVAIVRKPDKHTLISNLKNRRTCQSGVGKATGWIIPLNVVLDTRQITVLHCRLMHAYSELVSRACIPGIMQAEYNPTGNNPINLCENCAAGGKERCWRNNRELYYGDSGAFRCLVEESGDVAFARHTTVFDNTAGHNPSHWARNRRADDFELLCSDGSRRGVDQWQTCNLGRIPGNVLVTAGFKDESQRRTIWELLKFGQDFYATDKASSSFHMFNSPFDQTDLMFQDITESLTYIPLENQTYQAWLGQDFIRKVDTLEWKSCRQGFSGIVQSSATSVFLSRWMLGLMILIRFLC